MSVIYKTGVSIPVRVENGKPLCPDPYCPDYGQPMRPVDGEQRMWECPYAADLAKAAHAELTPAVERILADSPPRPNIRHSWRPAACP